MKKLTKLTLIVSVFFSLIILLSINAYASPYLNKSFYLKQPDNTKVEVKVSGDEYYQDVESVDGYTLCRDPKTGWICYAVLSNDGMEYISSGEIYKGSARINAKAASNSNSNSSPSKHMRIKPESINNKRDIAKKQLLKCKNNVENSLGAVSSPTGGKQFAAAQAAPLAGNVTGLTILVNFPNESSTISKANITDMINKAGYTGYYNNGSVRDYFYDISGGSMTYTNSVNGFYTAKHPKSYYNDTSVPYAQRAVELVTEALQWLDSTGFNYATLTTDSRKKILAVNILYAGDPDVGWGEGIWPHQGWVNFSADGVSTYMYEISNIGNDLSIGTFCHENGHMICDYPDLYDYTGSTNGCGMYSIMSYSENGKNPPPPDPFCRNIISGWNSTSVLNNVTEGATVTALANPKGAQNVYRWNGSYSDEYFLIENIRKAGRYSDFPDEGLLIWHVDEDGDNSDNTKPFMVVVEQSDGLNQLERRINYGADSDLFHAGYKTVFNDDTIPSAKWHNNTNSGIKISNIGAIGDAMTFVKGINTNQAPVVEAGNNQKITLPAATNLSGTVTDDGKPNNTITTTWTKDSGSGTVTFGNASAKATTVSFSEAGTYVLRLTASDGALSSYDIVTITVKPAGTPDYDVYYKFDETSGTTAADSSGNGKNATLRGTISWVAGKSGNAVSLDGSSGYASLPAGVVSSLDDFTITAWVKLNRISSWIRVFDFGTGTTTNMYLTASNGSVPWFAITTGGNGSEQRINGTSALITGTWTHVAVSLSGSTGILYVNGTEVARNTSMTLKPSSLGNTTQNYIGKSQYSDPYLNGEVDEFKIYRRALSVSEISTLAKGGPEIKKGDLNDDGYVDALDLALYKQCLLKIADEKTIADYQYVMDLNNDNYRDAIDFALLKQYLMKNITEFPS
ncbi:MAG TPA: M6 family metalloprotease domain-containing protein [Clostridia bacterium]|nr:M6 family metalloprotease domain-containing protein [Clostridia bacterium]